MILVDKINFVLSDAQNELGKLDILVCGQCHMVFHFVEQFQDHRLLGNCTGLSSIRENNIVSKDVLFLCFCI